MARFRSIGHIEPVREVDTSDDSDGDSDSEDDDDGSIGWSPFVLNGLG